MKEICGLDIDQLQELIQRRQLSIREVAQAFLDRIDEVDSQLRTFLTVEPRSVLGQADELDRRLKAGQLSMGWLTGIPVAVKDVIITRGLRTTCASRMLADYVPPYDATVVRKLRNDGAILLGKTNCDEFSMGSSTENSAFFPTRNPWDLERVPGGSSGGSAASVAAREAPVALGTDTGGSIRQPAAFCGIVGLKPTYGRVSRYGLVAFGSSLDQIGPLTSNVRDSARVLQVVAGPDPLDSTCSKRPVDDYLGQIGRDIRGVKIGIPLEWFGPGLDEAIEEKIRDAIRTLEGLGGSVLEVHLPHTKYAIATYYIIAPAEASSNLARYDGVKYTYRSPRQTDLESMYKFTRSEGFGDEVKRRIMLGTYALSAGYYDAYYLKASKVRTLVAQDYLKAFQQVDVLMGPTTPSLPFRFGEKTGDPLEMYLSDVYTVTANLAGIPGLVMPCGFNEEGLPVGVQMLAGHFQEGKLLRVAHALEKALALEAPALGVESPGK